MKTQLIMTMGGRGGVGKSIALMAIADYLQSRGHEFLTADCDTENAGKLSCFARWFNGKTVLLNLRNPADCDRLLSGSATAGVPFVLADLPSNASGDIAAWWKEVVTPETLQELNLGITAIGVVTPQLGSAESVCEWMDTLGANIQYLVALNRLLKERVESPVEEVFEDWLSVDTKGILVQSFQIPYLYDEALVALIRSRKLPSKAVKGTELFVLKRSRVKAWIDRIHLQLDNLDIFKPETTAELAEAK